ATAVVFEEEIAFPDLLGDPIRIQVDRFSPPELTHEQRVRGEVAFMVLRAGVRWRVPAILHAAQRLHHALYEGHRPFRPRRIDGKSETEIFLEQLLEDLELELERGRLLVV